MSRRALQRQQRILERRGGPTQPTVQARNLPNALFDHERLRRQTYLTVPELVEYLRFTSAKAARDWLAEHPQVKCSRGRTLLAFRRGVDEAVQPQGQALRRCV